MNSAIFLQTIAEIGGSCFYVPVLSFNFINQEQLLGALSQPEQFSCLIITSPRAAEAIRNCTRDWQGTSALLSAVYGT